MVHSARFNATEVDYWCYSRSSGGCPPVTEGEIERFVENLGACLKARCGSGPGGVVQQGPALGARGQRLQRFPGSG